MPIGQTLDGLPIRMQIVGKRSRLARLLGGASPQMELLAICSKAAARFSPVGAATRMHLGACACAYAIAQEMNKVVGDFQHPSGY